MQRNLNYFPKVDEAAANRTEPSINSHRRLPMFLFIVKIMSHKDDVIGEKKMLAYALNVYICSSPQGSEGR